ncbi:MAG: DUF861 domain-containing protein [Candidatus Lokiarchaeota archaeon]|nr:DUF861 domain-containing protein [Candidatus Lokiarchaeota archaeon]
MKVKVRKPSEDEIKKMESWPIWTKEVSEFDWSYDSKETCYLLKGEVDVETPDGVVHFEAGDLVVFPEGLDCVWKVKKPVKKHYNFG